MSTKIYVLTVTYGNRFDLVKQVIDNTLSEGVDCVYVVDNHSSNASRQALQNYEKKLQEKLRVVYLKDNLGSSGGYKAGLEAIMQNPPDWVWFLDDDNVPLPGALKNLLLSAEYLKNFPKPFALLSYREQFSYVLKNYLIEGCDFSYKHNAFVQSKPWRNFLRTIFHKQEREIKFPLSKIDMAPYGGVFIPLPILQKIGYPDERFFVYVDDLEYTYRITATGGAIFLCSESKIQDVDSSYNQSSSTFQYFQKEQDINKLYYYIRNCTYFYRKLKTNSLAYLFNAITWFILTVFRGLRSPRTFFSRMSIILKAIQDGRKEKLGRNFQKK